MRCGRDMVVVRVAGKIRRGNECEKGSGGRVDARFRDLIPGERLSAPRIDELSRRCGEIALPHRVGRNGRVLVEHVARFIAAVVDLEAGASKFVLVKTRDLDRSAERGAVVVLCERRLVTGTSGRS